MSNQPPRVYTGITPERYEQLKTLAGAKGLNLAPQLSGANTLSGAVHLDHCTFGWILNREAEILTIECLSHPFYISLETIYEKLDELLKM